MGFFVSETTPMSTYTDAWSSMDLPTDQSPKTRAYGIVADNIDRLNLSDADRYRMGWGPDAVPEEWVMAKAKEITDQINGADSTAILKRGLDAKPPTPEEIIAAEKKAADDKLAAAGAKSTTPVVPSDNGGNSNASPGNGGSTSRNTSTNDPANDPGWSTTVGWSGDKAMNSLKSNPIGYGLTALANPAAAFVRGLFSGVTVDQAPNAERQAVMDARAAGLTAEANAMAAADTAARAESMQNALNADTAALNGMSSDPGDGGGDDGGGDDGGDNGY